MSQDNRHILWDQEDHPSMELLQQYQADTLPPALSHQLERHLLDCELCTDIVEGQALAGAPEIDAAERDIHRRIAAIYRSRKRKPLPAYLADWRVAAALVMALSTTLLVFYYNYREISQQEQSIASATDNAMQESMGQGETPAASEPARLADAVPDTVRETLAAAPALPALRKRIASPMPRLVPQEPAPGSGMVQETNQAATVSADELATIPSTTITQTDKSIAYLQKSETVPEPTSVPRALEGRVAGVAIRGANSVASVAVKQVKGQVISSDGLPLPGVAVTVKGTTTGVATDAEGNFTLNLPADKATLAFRYIGYQSQEKTVDATTDHITVDLQVDNRSLSEVVVTGYGTTQAAPPVVEAARPSIGPRAYRRYLEENIRYTSDSQKGRVVVQATVSPTGELQDIQVTRSLCPSCDEEAMRLIRQGPAWKPSTSNGSGIEQRIRVVVRFNPERKR